MRKSGFCRSFFYLGVPSPAVTMVPASVAGGPAIGLLLRTIHQAKVVLLSPLRSRGEGSRSETGGLAHGQRTPLLHYVQLPPYFIGGIPSFAAHLSLEYRIRSLFASSARNKINGTQDDVTNKPARCRGEPCVRAFSHWGNCHDLQQKKSEHKVRPYQYANSCEPDEAAAALSNLFCLR